jgi:hypothetical protein
MKFEELKSRLAAELDRQPHDHEWAPRGFNAAPSFSPLFGRSSQ